MDKRLGHYQIVRMLGSGGMGQVYEAVHDQMKRRAAIKILHKRFAHNRQIATRFLNEAKATSMAEHPGIVHIYEFGQTDDGIAYIVMEYLSGETLRQRLDGQGGKLPPDDVMRLGRQIGVGPAASLAEGLVAEEPSTSVDRSPYGPQSVMRQDHRAALHIHVEESNILNIE